jgi:hypothetical protein
VIRLAAAPPPCDDAGGGGSLTGPHLEWCGQGFPTPDYRTGIFGLHGLSDASAVEWSIAFPPGDADIVGPATVHVLVVRFNGAPAGTVTAVVDGQTLSAEFDISAAGCEPV